MIATLPSALSLYRLAVARAKTLEPRVLVFGEVPADETSRGVPYLIVDPDPGSDSVSRGDGKVSSRSGRFRVRCCGSSREQALLALEATRGVFLNWRPYESLRFGMAIETDVDPLTIDTDDPLAKRYVLGLVYEVED